MNENYEVKHTQSMVLIALFTALITTVTMFIKIPSATGGYLNLGDFVVMISATILPFSGAVFAAGVGSALADIASGYAIYAIFTLFIKAGEAIIIFLLRKHLETKLRWIPFSIAALWMMVMYGLVQVLLTGQAMSFLLALRGDVFQGVICAVLATLFYPHIQRVMKRLRGK